MGITKSLLVAKNQHQGETVSKGKWSLLKMKQVRPIPKKPIPAHQQHKL